MRGGQGGLIDFLEGGRKKRRWYGQESIAEAANRREQSSARSPSAKLGPPSLMNNVLVTSADSALGQLVTLGLILQRGRVGEVSCEINAVVRFGSKPKESLFGPYATTFAKFPPELANDRSKPLVAVACCNGLGDLLLSLSKTCHLVYISPQPSKRGFFPTRWGSFEEETMVQSSGLPYTIVRTGKLVNTRGSYANGEALHISASKVLNPREVELHSISCEDAAALVVEIMQKGTSGPHSMDGLVIDISTKAQGRKESIGNLLDSAIVNVDGKEGSRR